MNTRNRLRAKTNLPNKDWANRHNEAIAFPRGAERPIVRLLEGWMDYQEQHRKRFESGIGEDYVLGQEWAKIGLSVRALLNGETGNLDCGTLDAAILYTLTAEGFDEDGGGRV